MSVGSFLADITFAYNSTVDVPPFDVLYFKVPVLSDEAAFKAGLNKLKVLHTCWSNQLRGATFNEKLIDLARNLDRASPYAYQIIERYAPSWHAVLNPKGGKVPTTYLFKQLGQRVEIVADKLGAQTMAVVTKTLEKEIVPAVGRILTACLGADMAAVEKVIAGIGEKLSSNVLAKLAASPEVQWAWLAGWIGLWIGSVGYALLEVCGANEALFQSWMVPIFDWAYDVQDKERQNSEMRVRLAQMRLHAYHESIDAARRAGAGEDVCAALARMMKGRVEDLARVNL